MISLGYFNVKNLKNGKIQCFISVYQESKHFNLKKSRRIYLGILDSKLSRLLW